MMSLRARLILAASVVLTIFIVIAGYALERAFYTSAEKSLQDSLHGHLSLLLASAEFTAQGDIDMPARLLDSKFSLPSSGLYGIIITNQHQPLWKSLSTIGITLPEPLALPAGEKELHQFNVAGEDYLLLSYGVDWYTETAKQPITFNIITELQPFNEQIYAFRRTLFLWLSGLAVALLLTQLLVLVWGLGPLRKVRHELRAIDRGAQTRITGQYPSELRLLTENINELLEHEHAQQTRYRNALADLAHSLKTPLAVLHGAVSEIPANVSNKATLEEQIRRMDHIVAHQLQRAAAAGSAPVRKSLELAPVLDKMFTALGKVYRDKAIRYSSNLTTPVRLRVDEGDAMEVLGNLLDNASKWCKQQVQVQVISQEQRVQIRIEDDGPGVPAAKLQHILQRGGRLDEAVSGQGIGLSVANEIISHYGGTLRIEHSSLGGAAFCLDLPAGE